MDLVAAKGEVMLENTPVARQDYAELFARRVRDIITDAKCTYDQNQDDLVLEMPSTSTFRVPMSGFFNVFNPHTGHYVEEMRSTRIKDFDSDVKPSDVPIAVTPTNLCETPTDARIVKNLVERRMCPDMAGIPTTQFCNYRRELSEDAVSCAEFVPTRFELELLAEQWFYSEISDDFSRFATGTVGSEYKLAIFGSRRLDRIACVLGEDLMIQIQTRARQRLLRESGDADAVWLFLYGDDADCEQCHELLKRVMRQEFTTDELKRQLAELRKAAESRRLDSTAEPDCLSPTTAASAEGSRGLSDRAPVASSRL